MSVPGESPITETLIARPCQTMSELSGCDDNGDDDAVAGDKSSDT